MRDIQKEIQENLDAIEEKYSVKILLAVESGSRAWGFASPDSDYDVRFIYMQKPGQYLRIDPQKDVIEWQLDEVLDINGWDLKKALLAFAKGNPNIMEWSNSPLVYRKAKGWDKIKETAVRYFSEKSALCHYYGTARSTLEGFLTGEKIRYKKYFYALRPLLCCRWIERYHTIPPMEFERLLQLFDGSEEDLGEELYAAIQELLARKVQTEEKDMNLQMPVIIEFIRNECERQKLIADSAPDDHRHDYEALNEVFRETLGFGEKEEVLGRQYIGVDGCRGGWIAAVLEDGNLKVEKYDTIHQLVSMYPIFDAFLIDMAVGLPEGAEDQRPDSFARKLLSPRSSTIFSVPARKAVYADGEDAQKEANKEILGKSLAKQTIGIIPKIRELDEFLEEHKEYKNVICESHPELCFAKLNGRVLLSKKKDGSGFCEREKILSGYIRKEQLKGLRDKAKELRCNPDDVMDAVCLAVVAMLKAKGKTGTIPISPQKDARGLYMQMILPEEA